MSGVKEELRKIMKDLNCKTSWKVREEALENSVNDYDLNNPEYQCLKDKIIELTLNDKVIAVKEAGLKVCKNHGLTKNQKPIFLSKKDIKYQSKDFNKIISRIKKEKEMEDFNLEDLKKQFSLVAPEMYDVMQFEKGEKFDKWIENIYRSLRK